MTGREKAERETALWHLARDICWAEFSCPKIVGRTKAQYWNEIHEDSRKVYMEDARRFLWTMRQFGISYDKPLRLLPYAKRRPSPVPGARE